MGKIRVGLLAKAAIGVPVLLAAWGGVALVNAQDAGASPMPGKLYFENGDLVFEAGTGTVNEVVMGSLGAGNGFDFSDDVPVTLDPARAGTCTQSTATRIHCTSLPQRTRINLEDGNDSLFGLGHLLVQGGDGDDFLRAGYETGPASISGGPGNDTIEGGLLRDVIHAGAGDDKVKGLDGNDVITGGTGKDELHGDGGDDLINSGVGRDTVRGGDGKDDLRSTYADDNVYGGPGNDLLGSGVDVFGEAGDDRVVMSESTGEYWGGLGKDVIDYSEWGHEVRVSLDGNGNDGGKGADCDDWIGCPVTPRHNVHGDFEHVVGTAHDDKISGNGQADDLDGMGGDDRLYGNGGDDYLDAGQGANQHTDGGTGFDTCVGYGIVARPGCDA